MSAPLVIATEAKLWRSLCGWRFSTPYFFANLAKYRVGLCGFIGSVDSFCVNTHSLELHSFRLRSSCMTSGSTPIVRIQLFFGVSRYTPRSGYSKDCQRSECCCSQSPRKTSEDRSTHHAGYPYRPTAVLGPATSAVPYPGTPEYSAVRQR